MKPSVAIIGGGLAGLACAITLHNQNIPFKLFESSDACGGRVRTQTQDGYQFDTGFQVLLPWYPSIRKLLNLKDLDLCYYPKGANIINKTHTSWVGNPFEYKYKTPHLTPFKLKDIWNILKDTQSVKSVSNISDTSTADHIAKNYSPNFAADFLNPFFRGIFLDPHCESSKTLFQFYLHCFYKKGAAVPKKGMHIIPKKLLAQLPTHAIETQTPVQAIHDTTLTINNKQHTFSQVVIATDPSSTETLLNQPIKTTWRHVYSTILATTSNTTLAPLTLVSQPSPISHFNIPSIIGQSVHKQPNTHLAQISSFTQSHPDLIATEFARLTNESHWKVITQCSIPRALPNPNKKKFQLQAQQYICGDHMSFASIEGALASGIRCANTLSDTNKLTKFT